MRNLIPLSKISLLIFFVCLIYLQGNATVYTFETEGYYLDESNWDSYPGTELSNGDTILIEANCLYIELEAQDGLLIIAESVQNLSIDGLRIYSGCQFELNPENLIIEIWGFFEYNSSNSIISPFNPSLYITNNGSGLHADNSFFGNMSFVEYINFGTQSADLLEYLPGDFVNYGMIEVFSPQVYSYCNLDLFDGSIIGFMPFDFHILSEINQSCTDCTATITEINALHIYLYSNFKGTVILNSPE